MTFVIDEKSCAQEIMRTGYWAARCPIIWKRMGKYSEIAIDLTSSWLRLSATVSKTKYSPPTNKTLYNVDPNLDLKLTNTKYTVTCSNDNYKRWLI